VLVDDLNVRRPRNTALSGPVDQAWRAGASMQVHPDAP